MGTDSADLLESLVIQKTGHIFRQAQLGLLDLLPKFPISLGERASVKSSVRERKNRKSGGKYLSKRKSRGIYTLQVDLSNREEERGSSD
jgi:hypothetical protein